MGDDDLRAHLPEPPPPAPKPREAAIGAALARFNGSATSARPPQRPSTRPWRWLQRPQASRLITAALVGAVSLPFAWTMFVPGAPATDEQASIARFDDGGPIGLDRADAPVAPPLVAESPPKVAMQSEVTAAAPEPSPASSDIVPPPPPAVSAMSVPQQAELALSAPAESADRRETLLAMAIPVAPAPPPPPAPPSPQVSRLRALEQTDSARVASSDIRVLGSNAAANIVAKSQSTPEKPLARGDWNACTVDDPGKTLADCKTLAKPAAKAVRAKASAALSRGLQQAWQGDMRSAIASFDQAIADAPDLSIAYLNRGLANDRQGFSARALADLDRAVTLAPQSARAHFNRARLLRKYGDTLRAAADEARAIELDPRYKAVLR